MVTLEGKIKITEAKERLMILAIVENVSESEAMRCLR